jgi:dTDP-glucose pyrophosphorylase
MLLVGGRPLIDYALDQFYRAGIDSIVVVYSAGHEETVRYLAGCPLPVAFVPQRGNELPGAILSARPFLAGHRVLFMMPDTIIEPPDALRQVDRTCMPLGVGLFRTAEPWRFGMCEVNDGRLGRIQDKPLTWAGGYLWGLLAWDEWPGSICKYMVWPGGAKVTVTDALAAWVHAYQGCGLACFDDGMYLDVGTPESLAEAREYVNKKMAADPGKGPAVEEGR